jgi:hypothetical protein
MGYGAGGSIAGNGGGLAEKNMVFAFENLGEFIHFCLLSSECHVTEEERSLLLKIRSSLPKEKSNSHLLNFYDGKDSAFFKIDDVVRVAKTGDHVGDSIYVNPHLLYDHDAQGIEHALGIPMATSVLIHELGHHHGIKDHVALDAVGTKVQLVLLKNIERSEFWNGQGAVITLQMNSVRSDEGKDHLDKFDQLILENSQELSSLTDSVVKNIHCPKNLENQKPTGLRIYNLHGERGIKFDEKSQILSKPFRAWYILSCESGKESDHGDLAISLAFKKTTEGSLKYLSDRTSVKQISCKKSPQVCL